MAEGSVVPFTESHETCYWELAFGISLKGKPHIEEIALCPNHQTKEFETEERSFLKLFALGQPDYHSYPPPQHPDPFYLKHSEVAAKPLLIFLSLTPFLSLIFFLR